MEHTESVSLQIECNYHRLKLQFRVSGDCPSVVAAVAGEDNAVVAIVDNDDFDQQRLYKYVRVWFWMFSHHNSIDVYDRNYSVWMVV